MSKVTDIKEYKRKRSLKNFVLFPKDLLSDHSIKPSTKVVYLVLAKYADNGTGICFPSLKTIVKESGFSKRTVDGALNELVENEYIIRIRRKADDKNRNKTNKYILK